MFFLTMVVFGIMTLATEAGCETINATVMMTPKPNTAVAIPFNMIQHVFSCVTPHDFFQWLRPYNSRENKKSGKHLKGIYLGAAVQRLAPRAWKWHKDDASHTRTVLC
jgi:hypothetical protein